MNEKCSLSSSLCRQDDLLGQCYTFLRVYAGDTVTLPTYTPGTLVNDTAFEEN